MEELEREGIGKVPERGATTREHVAETIELRGRWIERNYPAVTDIGVGRGWGVTYTRDEYGEITFHRAPDHIIVATIDRASDCPDPEKGTLMIFSTDGLRVPVRFEYRTS